MHKLLRGNLGRELRKINNVHKQNRDTIESIRYGIFPFYQALSYFFGKDIVQYAFLGCGTGALYFNFFFALGGLPALFAYCLLLLYFLNIHFFFYRNVFFVVRESIS